MSGSLGGERDEIRQEAAAATGVVVLTKLTPWPRMVGKHACLCHVVGSLAPGRRCHYRGLSLTSAVQRTLRATSLASSVGGEAEGPDSVLEHSSKPRECNPKTHTASVLCT